MCGNARDSALPAQAHYRQHSIIFNIAKIRLLCYTIAIMRFLLLSGTQFGS